MSVSTISHANASAFAKNTSLKSVSAKDGSAFASLLQTAKQLEQVDAAQAQGANIERSTTLNSLTKSSLHDAPIGSTLSATSLVHGANQATNPSSFAQMLSQASDSLHHSAHTNQIGVATLAKESDFSISDLYNQSTLVASRNIRGIQSLNNVVNVQEVAPLQTSEIKQLNETIPNDHIALEHLTLDFSSLLPSGSRNLLKDLQCNEAELNGLVNYMVFGHENGPHGQNAANFFNAQSMSDEDLATSLQSLLDKAKLNSTSLEPKDYNFVLREEHRGIGESLATMQGESLEDRELAHDLDATFKRDMALMEILARSNNQSATIF